MKLGDLFFLDGALSQPLEKNAYCCTTVHGEQGSGASDVTRVQSGESDGGNGRSTVLSHSPEDFDADEAEKEIAVTEARLARLMAVSLAAFFSKQC